MYIILYTVNSVLNTVHSVLHILWVVGVGLEQCSSNGNLVGWGSSCERVGVGGGTG